MQGTKYAHQWWWTMSAALFILLWIGMMCVEMGGAFFDGYMFHSALLAIAARQLTGVNTAIVASHTPSQVLGYAGHIMLATAAYLSIAVNARYARIADIAAYGNSAKV
jgi:Kef-type K+ transport system membrane component KefB